MLTLVTNHRQGLCNGASRRDFLRVGTLSLGGWMLPQWFALRAAMAGESYLRDRAVVLLYLSGGASHIETFDPKMTAPEGVRSITGEVATTLPGVSFGGTFPLLAQQAKRMAVVRSFSHNVGDHGNAHVHVLSGGSDPQGMQTQGFSIGSLCAKLRAGETSSSGLPSYITLTEQEIDGQYNRERERFVNGSWPGKLGSSYAPFPHEIGWQGQSDAAPARQKSKTGKYENPLLSDMRLNLNENVLRNRMELLRQLDGLQRNVDASGTMRSIDGFSAQALDLVLGGAKQAFDLSQEDRATFKAYDTSSIRIGHKTFRPSTLGKQLLAARRLCEAGCGFVSVHSAGWDMHADGNNPPIARGMEMLGRSLDQAVSAFLEDLHQRALSDKILLVITGDFGRTPKANKNGGRDHWAKLGTLAFAGGALRMGQVVGQSERGVDAPATTPITPGNVLSTIAHTLFDVGQLRITGGIPADILRAITQHSPISELV